MLSALFRHRDCVTKEDSFFAMSIHLRCLIGG
jgi:hypothetical protein